MELWTFLTHRTGFMMVKLSSLRIMLEATSIPAIPMANPTSAFFRARALLGPSLVVTATTC